MKPNKIFYLHEKHKYFAYTKDEIMETFDEYKSLINPISLMEFLKNHSPIQSSGIALNTDKKALKIDKDGYGSFWIKTDRKRSFRLSKTITRILTDELSLTEGMNSDNLYTETSTLRIAIPVLTNCYIGKTSFKSNKLTLVKRLYFSTLTWSEGMSHWQPLGAVRSAFPSSAIARFPNSFLEKKTDVLYGYFNEGERSVFKKFYKHFEFSPILVTPISIKSYASDSHDWKKQNSDVFHYFDRFNSNEIERSFSNVKSDIESNHITSINSGLLPPKLDEISSRLLEINNSISKEKDLAKHYKNRAELFLSLGYSDLAKLDLANALIRFPKNHELSYHLSNLIFSTISSYESSVNNKDIALCLMSYSIYCKKDFARAFNNLGAMVRWWGDFSRSKECFSSAISINSMNKVFWINRSTLESISVNKSTRDHSIRIKAAISDLDEAIKLDQKDANLYIKRGDLYNGPHNQGR